MPVCTTCAFPVKHLYTTYKTRSNIRLTVCPRCNDFADPLIEHPPLILLLDLILLKPRVFLHLLFNRGSEPLDATRTEPLELTARDDGQDRQKKLWTDTVELALMALLAETAVRVLPNYQGTDHLNIEMDDVMKLFKVICAVSLEMVAQHITTIALALLCLGLREKLSTDKTKGTLDRDGRKEHFQPVLISLTLLYTTLLPLLFQLILSIWYDPKNAQPDTVSWTPILTSYLPEGLGSVRDVIDTLEQGLMHTWYRSDRIWVGTRLLGGMSAGFGLRVLLPTGPVETTAIVLSGWMAADQSRKALQNWT